MSSEWGRIDADGSVYLRTAEGERQIGSWQAGTPEEGIAFYTKRYNDLAADVALLEARAKAPSADPTSVREAATKLAASITDAAALGDLAGLTARLDGVYAKTDERLAEKAVERAKAAEAAVERKRALVAEAEKLSKSDSWKASTERFRAIVEEWKTIRIDRKTDSALWDSFAAARRSFDARRRTHFAELDAAREAVAERKTKIAAEAEKLAESSEWGPTAKRFRDLMTDWKAAGRANRGTDDELWNRFKAAQDAFFARRSEAFSARDDEQTANLAAKQELLAEARRLDAKADPTGARKRLKSIHDRWEKIGHVPRDDKDRLERELGDIERTIRDSADAGRTVIKTESTIVIRLRESVQKLEARLERARAAGDQKLVTETEESLTTQREWLTQAEASS
ncbi:MAG TPA: DUF349 domain-containing protein [Mycobacteriales bacterium]|jgi:hypothetical protein|nr:DUF349 domain-containing protein [Mycobacteriales bacterium]